MKILSFHDWKAGYSKSAELLSLDSAADGFALRSGVNLLVAPNGTGKSTFLRTLAGNLDPLSGRVTLDGKPIDPARHSVYFSEYLSFPKYVYPAEWIEFIAERKPGADIEIWVRGLRLESKMGSFMGRMSQGERRKTNWLAAHESTKPIILMDEPFEGLDILALPWTLKMIDEWRKQGRIVCLVSHRLTDLIPLADEILAIDGRKLRSITRPAEFGKEADASGRWKPDGLRDFLIEFYARALGVAVAPGVTRNPS